MKTKLLIVCIIIAGFSTQGFAYQRKKERNGMEKFGSTINAGVGLAYFNFIGEAVPVGHINYEIDVEDNITIAPFITYFGHHEYAFPDQANPLFRHYYRESVIPVGVTGYYYFDDMLGVNDNWDFYAGLSLGAQIMRKVWQDGYVGSSNVALNETKFYIDGHIGAEYHLGREIGFTLDISRGISMVGLAVHL